MIPFKLIITIFITLFSSSIESFINEGAVFKRSNKTLKCHNYIITCGDIHEAFAYLNNDHIKGTKSVIYNADPNQTLFLAEDIASIKISHPLLNDVVKAINLTYSNPNTKNKIPLVTLVNYALINKKNAINLDDRAHTLIQTIFYYLVVAYIQKTKYPFMTGQHLPIDYKISLPEIGSVLHEFLQNFENGYLEMHTKLRTLESNAKNIQSQNPSDTQEMLDLRQYIEFYNSFANDIENDKKYADSLITKNFDLIDYFVKEYKGYKNIKTLNLESPIDGYNFNLYVGSTFFTKMLTFGSYTIELKALKFIIENLNSKTRIFVFAGQKHIRNLNQFLEKMSFKKIYHRVQTKDVSKIYGNITDHIQQAKSFNKVNNQYILKMKQNLVPIDPNFFKICQKKHLYAKDFKDLK